MNKQDTSGNETHDCFFSFKTQADLDTHLPACLDPPKHYQCLICSNKTFQRKSAFLRHVKRCQFCVKCKKYTIEANHDVKCRRLRCVLCQKSFARAFTLKRHWETAHPDDSVPFDWNSITDKKELNKSFITFERK